MLKLRIENSNIPTEAMGFLIHIVYVVFSFLTVVLLAHLLGPEALGKYTYLISLTTLTATFITAGLPVFLVREISLYKHDHKYFMIKGIIFSSLLLIVLLFSLISIGILLIYNANDYDPRITLPLLFSLFFLSFRAIYEAATTGHGKVILGQLASKVISPVLTVILIISLAFYSKLEGFTVSNAFYIYFSATLITSIAALFFFQSIKDKKHYYKKEYQFRQWGSSLWKISILGWLGALNIQISFILIGYLSNDSDVGNFRVAGQIASLIPFGLMVINSLQMPTLSTAFNNEDQKELKRLANRSCIISFFSGIPIIFVALFFGDSLITTAFGSEFKSANDILLILIIGQIINISAGSTGLLMIISRKERVVMMTQGFSLFLNISFCIILIPVIGALGAAIASSASIIFRNIFLILYLYRKLGVLSLPIVWRAY